MTISIRTKLFIIFSILVLFIVLMSLSFIRFGIEKYYIWHKKDVLMTNSQKLDNLYHGNPEEISMELEWLANTLGAGVIVFTPEGYIKYSSSGRIINQKLQDTPLPLQSPQLEQNDTSSPPSLDELPQSSLNMFNNNKEVIDGHNTLTISRNIITTQQGQRLKNEFIALEHRFKNNDVLIIRQPLAPVAESAILAARFMTIVGILFILLGCLWTFFLSGKLTFPIMKLSWIAQSMSRLDFSQKYTVNHNDELGELGHSINHLSAQLDTAISELSKENQQLMADIEKEKALDKMRKIFISSVSHELKTPLSLILGYAEGLKENVARNEDRKNFYCSIIIKEAEKMDQLLKDLLNLSQIESGFFQLNKIDFNLQKLLNNICEKYHKILEEKEITLELEKTSGYLVNGDILRIEQILLNIFNNAISHAEFAKIIRILVEDTGNKIRVSIYNSGRPIPESSLEKIWTSFYKVDKARTREHGGYGLGLSIVRAIQDLHNNRYGVENLSDGVNFWFELDKSENVI